MATHGLSRACLKLTNEKGLELGTLNLQSHYFCSRSYHSKMQRPLRCPHKPASPMKPLQHPEKVTGPMQTLPVKRNSRRTDKNRYPSESPQTLRRLSYELRNLKMGGFGMFFFTPPFWGDVVAVCSAYVGVSRSDAFETPICCGPHYKLVQNKDP